MFILIGVLLCMTISILKKKYWPIALVPFFIAALVFINTFLDKFLQRRFIRILNDRAKEITYIVDMFNEDEFISNGIKLETG